MRQEIDVKVVVDDDWTVKAALGTGGIEKLT